MKDSWPPVEVITVTETFRALLQEAAPGALGGLYLHGSVGFGEWYPGRSDIDYVAVLDSPVPTHILRGVHARLVETFPSPPFDGFFCTWADLGRPPGGLTLRCTQDGVFHDEEELDVHPVTWHELARHGVTLSGPDLDDVTVWTDPGVLHDYVRENLGSYWADTASALRRFPDEAGGIETIAWVALGVSRLHHLLATGELIGKTGAGLYAEKVFDGRYHELIGEALSYRTLGIPTPDFEPGRLGPLVAEFCSEVVSEGVRLDA